VQECVCVCVCPFLELIAHLQPIYPLAMHASGACLHKKQRQTEPHRRRDATKAQRAKSCTFHQAGPEITPAAGFPPTCLRGFRRSGDAWGPTRKMRVPLSGPAAAGPDMRTPLVWLPPARTALSGLCATRGDRWRPPRGWPRGVQGQKNGPFFARAPSRAATRENYRFPVFWAWSR
jgi:hypothetical protein